MEKFKEDMGKILFGRSREKCAEDKTCICCGGPATEFRNEISRREYEISRMCQKCQDEVFR